MIIHFEYEDDIPSGQPDCKRPERHIDVKQKIRLAFSNQLRRHWKQGLLAEKLKGGIPVVPYQRGYATQVPDPDVHPFFRVDMCGFSVIPLVTYHNWLACECEFVFSGDQRGAIDFDNQMKIVFDALRMPQHSGEVPGSMFGHGQDLFCVLEDDSLIRKYSVESRYVGGTSPPQERLHVTARVTYDSVGMCHPALDRFR